MAKNGHGQKPRKVGGQRDKRSKIEDVEIQNIDKIISEQAPPRGTNPLAMTNPERPTFATARKFEDLPLSRYTKEALKEAKFISLTAIQRAALPHALAGRDVLGAAKTGSGKTLAFLIPLIERLYRQKWGQLDGLGALVVSPTRELALQIFSELRKVGRRHEFSAGLLIGGKSLREEAECITGMNILVATPGRLLQHMDETPGFDASPLQVLILDEADRILDMGFAATINAVVANLPRERQTLLFSATQAKSVGALARLSLNSPEYVSAHAEADAPTPVRLEQAYMEIALQEKLDVLWSFIKTHLKCRIIVFLSTCKQVRFVYEAFRRLRPGTPLRALHGRMSQYKRMGVYQQFCDSKASVLFATDIAARGLDFPSIDWVVQADCPEDVAAYIHRVGRTARYTSAGRGLLLLLPSEKEGMLAALEEAKIKIKSLKHNPAKMQPVTPALQALLSKDTEVKEIAQRALVSYLRSVFLQPNRAVFDVTALPAAEYALSLGLPNVPKLRFLKRNAQKIGRRQEDGENPEGSDASEGEAGGDGGSSSSSSSDSEGEAEREEEDGRGKKRKAGNLTAHAAANKNNNSDDDDLLVVKRRYVYGEDDENAAADEVEAAATAGAAAAAAVAAKQKKKKLRIDPRKTSGNRVVFDDDGAAVAPLELLARGDGMEDTGSEDDLYEGHHGGGAKAGLHTGVHATVADRAAATQAVMARRDAEDKATLRSLRKAQRDEKRAKRLARERMEEGPVAMLGAGSSGEEYSSSEDEEGEGDGGFGHADVDLLNESDSEEEIQEKETKLKKHKSASRPEVAHLGMLPTLGGERGKEKKRQKKGEAKGMSLAEQEALALHLLRKG